MTTLTDTATRTVSEVSPQWMGTVELHHTEMTAWAHKIAGDSHAGVLRTLGDAYIDHPLRVAQHLQLSGFGEEIVAAALLHDVVEDSSWTPDDLRTMFPESVVGGVLACTKRAGEDYVSLVERAAAHPVGRYVKLADTLDNSAPHQLAPLSPEKRSRVRAKYSAAQIVLIRSLGDM